MWQHCVLRRRENESNERGSKLIFAKAETAIFFTEFQ